MSAGLRNAVGKQRCWHIALSCATGSALSATRRAVTAWPSGVEKKSRREAVSRSSGQSAGKVGWRRRNEPDTKGRKDTPKSLLDQLDDVDFKDIY